MKFLRRILAIFFVLFFNQIRSESLVRINCEFKQSYKCLIASDKYIYVASDLGLYKFNGQNLKKVPEINNAVYDLYEDKLKTIWIINNEGSLFYKKADQAHFIKVSTDFSSNFVFAKVMFETKSELYVRLVKKINKGKIFDTFACVNKINAKAYRSSKAVSANINMFINIDFTFQTFYNKKAIYTGWNEDEMIILDSVTGRFIKKIEFPNNQINYLKVYNGKLVLVFDHGIFHLNDSSFKLRELYKVEHPTCLAIKNNDVYISSLVGFYKTVNKPYELCEWSANKFINSCCVISEDQLFYVDKNYNLFQYKNSKNNLVLKNNLNRFSYYNNMFYFSNYLNFNRLLFSFKEKKILYQSYFLTAYDTVLSNGKMSLLAAGYLISFISSEDMSIRKRILYGEKTNDISKTDRLIVIATDKGLLYNSYEYIRSIEDSLTDYSKYYHKLLNGVKIVDLEEIGKNRIAVLTENNGFYIFANGRIVLRSQLTPNKDFLFDQVKFVNDSTFAFSSKNGILMMNYKTTDGNAPVLKKTGYFPIIFRDKETSLLNNINVWLGKLYVSTSEGLYQFAYAGASDKAKVEFKFVDLTNNNGNNIIINETSNNEMDVKTNALIFKYDLINYNPVTSFEKQIRYRLIVNRSDTSVWQFTSSDDINLWSLKKGQYQLQIQYLNNDLEWVFIKEYLFFIPLHFFETVWFILLIIIISFIIIFVTIYYTIDYRRKTLQNENYELKFLKTQMNPHFVFNALNSLKSLIFLNEYNRSLKYIDNLAVFFRSVLEHNEKPEIGLDEELKNCQSYIALENIRLNNSINFNWEIEPGCGYIVLPSNILQPLIENSIKHGYGFGQKQEKLEIMIKVRNQQNAYLLEIADNGTGLKKQDNSKDSFALKSIEKRLNRFNNNLLLKSLTIENNYDKDYNIQGVTCTITLKKQK